VNSLQKANSKLVTFAPACDLIYRIRAISSLMSPETALISVRSCVVFSAPVSHTARLANLLQYANSMRSKAESSTSPLVRTISRFACLKK